MAASPAFPDSKAIETQQALVARTDVNAMATGTGSRSVRRRTTPEAGFALEILGHAIEYLADEYVHEAGLFPRVHSNDPRVQAIQVLMAANREVYYACPLAPSLYQRVVNRLSGR